MSPREKGGILYICGSDERCRGAVMAAVGACSKAARALCRRQLAYFEPCAAAEATASIFSGVLVWMGLWDTFA
eukprot:6187738-Pleurochrysis_carterae.AAC.1